MEDNAELIRVIVTAVLIGIISFFVSRRDRKKYEQTIANKESLREKYTFRIKKSAIIAAFFLGALFTLPIVIYAITTALYVLLLVFSPAIAMGMFLVFLGIRYIRASITIDEEGLFFPLVIPKEVETVHLWHWVKEPTRIKWEEIKSIKIIDQVLIIETIHDKKYTYPIASCPAEDRGILMLYLQKKQINVITDQDNKAEGMTSPNISIQENAPQETTIQETALPKDRKSGNKKVGVIIGILMFIVLSIVMISQKAQNVKEQYKQDSCVERYHKDHERLMKEDSVYRQHYEEAMKYMEQRIREQMSEQK